MGQLGLLGTDLPEAFGGMGIDGVTTGLIVEELAYGDFNVSAGAGGHLAERPPSCLRHAQPEVAREWVAAHDPRRRGGGHLP